MCEAVYFGWERGFHTEDTHIFSVPSSACAREQSHTQLMNRGRAKNVPAFPVFLLPPGMNEGEAAAPLANPAWALFPLLAGVFGFAAPEPWSLPGRCMWDVSPALLFQDQLQNNTCLPANPLPTPGQMTQAIAQKYLTPLCQEIFQQQAQKEQSAEQKANCSSCPSKGEQIVLLKKGCKPRLSYNWKNINSYRCLLLSKIKRRRLCTVELVHTENIWKDLAEAST